MKYRKRAVTEAVEAFRYGYDDVPDWFNKYATILSLDLEILRMRDPHMRFSAFDSKILSHRTYKCCVGDYIILKGTYLTVMNNHNFLQLYEPVLEDTKTDEPVLPCDIFRVGYDPFPEWFEDAVSEGRVHVYDIDFDTIRVMVKYRDGSVVAASYGDYIKRGVNNVLFIRSGNYKEG